MNKQMVENSNATVATPLRTVTLKMLKDFKASIDDMNATAKDLINMGRIHEAGAVIAFSGYMLGVHTIALEVEAYAIYPEETLPPEISTIDLVSSQINRCSNMQKTYDLDLAIDYEQILHKLESLKDLLKAEQIDSAVLSDVTVKLIQVTLNAAIQLINDLFPESEEEAKPESTSDE